VSIAPQKGPAEEELPELPPLDGDEGDGLPLAAPDLEEDELPAGGNDPFDDKTGDPTQGDGAEELDLKGSEGGWLAEAEEADGLDVGDAELLSESRDLLVDNDEPGVENEDFGVGGDESALESDAGEEGPGDDDEELREEDLPRLDADEAGSPDDEDFIEEGFGAEEEALGVSWESPRWERVGSPVEALPVSTLTCVSGGLLAVGSSLVHIDVEGSVRKLGARGLAGGEAAGILSSDAKLWVTTEDGELFVSSDQGESFVRALAWRARVRPEEAAAGVEVAFAGDGLWARTAQGTLLYSGDAGTSFDVVESGGFVAAITRDALGGDLVAIVRTLRGGEIVRGKRRALTHSAEMVGDFGEELAGALKVAARGADLAVAPEGKAVRISLDAGATWTRAPATETTTAMAWFAGEVLTVGLYDERHERAYLARVAPRGTTRLLAEMSASPPDAYGGIRALAYDETRAIVWAAGGFGVAAFAPKRIA
jgi:hypothetical protein